MKDKENKNLQFKNFYKTIDSRKTSRFLDFVLYSLFPIGVLESFFCLVLIMLNFGSMSNETYKTQEFEIEEFYKTIDPRRNTTLLEMESL